MSTFADSALPAIIADWFAARDSMKRQIDKIDFDIAIIGCGAYGMFLAQYVKSLGKKAVHTAGATQLLFGIKGERWIHEHPEISKAFNENWTFPLPADTPKNLNDIMKYDIMETPALVINEEVNSFGGLRAKEEIMDW